MSTEAAEMSAVRAASTALLLMDFQNDIVALIADGDALVQRAAEARAWADANGVQVVHVRVAFRPEDYMEISPNNKRFGPRRGGGTMADETPGTASTRHLLRRSRTSSSARPGSALSAPPTLLRSSPTVPSTR